jgi:hypothetical protein
MVNFLSELKMVYYIVHGWILPSEKAEENLTQNLINMALLTLMKREYENENEEKANQKVSECLNWMTYLSEQKPRITWRINEKPSQEKMEDFLMEILELTEEGQMLLRARNQSLEPILYEYLIQDELDVLTLSQVLMNLPTP